jgi:coenzyme PQQ biosynthesis protein PqqD
MDQSRIPNKSPDLIWREMEDGTVIISPEGGQVRVLNDVGTLVWRLIDGQKTVHVICNQVSQEYEISAADAVNDVENFLQELDQRDILTWS